tara:strand:- start:646 stop:2100 length:1455 start_codon:yes stop_codon:yes gene_type:complete
MAINQSAPVGTPAPGKQTLPSNYLDFTGTTDTTWAQQYLPDLMEKEAEVFGNRTVSGFLEQVGAEEASASDQVVWSEQGRLHLSYSGTLDGAASGTGVLNGKVALPAGHGLRVGDTVIVSHAANNATAACLVSAIATAPASAVGGAITLSANSVHLVPFVGTSAYAALGVTGTNGAGNAVTLFVYGSAAAKGSNGRAESIEPEFKSYGNKMAILKDKYEVSGSDAAQIGWVEVSGEDGQSGYMWYLKAAGDTKVRFTDYCEMTMIESEVSTNAELIAGKLDGTQGLFAAIEDRGIIADAIGTASLSDFDKILKEFDKQGAIEENMMFLNRQQSLQVDDMLGGQINTAAGNSYGVFDNSAEMALNLGFSGFRRGSYDFYKSDWKYLNDSATRGVVADTNANRTAGVIVPAGTSSVYDQAMGKNIRRPFLHVRYRAAGMEDRRFKTWTTGSVGAATSDLDAMEMHFLSERCLVTQGANNFCLLKSN